MMFVKSIFPVSRAVKNFNMNSHWKAILVILINVTFSSIDTRELVHQT